MLNECMHIVLSIYDLLSERVTVRPVGSVQNE
jgi:hypothetical protein